MFVRQVKRKCSVRGCKSTDCFAISRVREVGNTVIICKSCLGMALGSIDEIDPKTKSNIPTIDNTAAPSLFFNAKALGIEATETMADDGSITHENRQENTNPPKIADGISHTDDVTKFKCHICGKTYDSEKGLKMHLRYCKQADNE